MTSYRDTLISIVVVCLAGVAAMSATFLCALFINKVFGVQADAFGLTFWLPLIILFPVISGCFGGVTRLVVRSLYQHAVVGKMNWLLSLLMFFCLLFVGISYYIYRLAGGWDYHYDPLTFGVYILSLTALVFVFFLKGFGVGYFLGLLLFKDKAHSHANAEVIVQLVTHFNKH